MNNDIALAGAVRRGISVVFVTSVFGLLCAPGIAQLFGSRNASPISDENRTLSRERLHSLHRFQMRRIIRPSWSRFCKTISVFGRALSP